MDIMKIKLPNKIMRGLVTKLIKKSIVKKFGYDIDIQIEELEIKNECGKVRLHLNADLETSSEEFTDIISKLIKD